MCIKRFNLASRTWRKVYTVPFISFQETAEGFLWTEFRALSVQPLPHSHDLSVLQPTFVRHHWVHRRRQDGKCRHCGKVRALSEGTSFTLPAGPVSPVWSLMIAPEWNLGFVIIHSVPRPPCCAIGLSVKQGHGLFSSDLGTL